MRSEPLAAHEGKSSMAGMDASILEIEPALAAAAKAGRTKDGGKAAKQPDAGANSL
jgi:hypothetical protein